VGAADLDGIPSAAARLDELALTAMVRAFAECVPQLADPQPRSPASVVAALGAAPRHSWLVRRWMVTLAERRRPRARAGRRAGHGGRTGEP
jgi:L-histidine N-alpha-methyltransferase